MFCFVIMRTYHQILSLIVAVGFALPACQPYPETIPLDTSICLKVQHHTIAIPDADVYIKYSADSFPGYAQPPAYFDAHLRADKNARLCFESVPEGTHYIIGYGYDSLYWPHNVKGSMRVTISLDAQPKLDTIFYISEE